MADSETTRRVREFFATVPEGSKYYLTSIDTPAGGARTDGARERVNDVCRELRDALRDRGVATMTILILYDEAEPARPAFEQLGLGEASASLAASAGGATQGGATAGGEGLGKPLRMRRKAGEPETWAYFDPDCADTLGPSWGLVKQGDEWWYHDDPSHYTVLPGRMVKLDVEGRYSGSANLRYFWDQYDPVGEE